MSKSSIWRLLAVLLAVFLIAAACGDDDDSESSEPTAEESADEEAAEEPAAEEPAAEEPAAEEPADDEEEDTVELTQGGDLLETVIANDVVRCGTRDAFPGWAVLNEDGTHTGFDNDFCRVFAAAILGDATKTDFVDLETADRFTALQSGEIDILVRNTTWTSGRDGTEAATFVQPNYYDGQGMMVAADGGITTMTDLDGGVVCSAGGTTTEGNVALEFDRLGISGEVLSFEDTDLLQEAFIAGRCDGWTSDGGQLVGLRSVYPDGPDALVILDVTFSKEPLAPAVLDGETALAQAVEWAVFATIQAEEWGITSANVDDFLTSEDPNILKWLGVEVDGTTFDPGLGLPTDFNYQIIKQVGNYAEIWEEHIAPLGLSRGLNQVWSDGGLLYAPPYK